MYLGLVALVVILAATNAYTLREPVHAVYAFHVLTLALTQSTLTGVSGLFFWPDSPRWNDASATVLPMLSLAAAAWFVRTVVSPPPRPWLGWLLWAYAAVAVILAISFGTLGRDPVFRLANYFFWRAFRCWSARWSGMPGSGRSMAGGSWPGCRPCLPGRSSRPCAISACCR